MNQPGSMQLRVIHTTGYHYEKGAVSSYNEARMTPQNTAEQYVLRSKLDITPSPWSSEYRDYWGTTVTAFEVHDPHGELTVVSTSTVETRPPGHLGENIAWEDLDEVADDLCEYLAMSDWVQPAESLLGEIDEMRASSATPAALATSVMSLVHDRMVYQPGATEVTTTAADAWEAGEGVCQDIAHVTIGALRRAGVPARYVSGYLHPSSEPELGATVAGESHAWVEYWDGDWVGFDPTNAEAVGARHIVVAKGRDYADNPPLRGIYSTAGGSELFVSVEMTRLS